MSQNSCKLLAKEFIFSIDAGKKIFIDNFQNLSERYRAVLSYTQYVILYMQNVVLQFGSRQLPKD